MVCISDVRQVVVSGLPSVCLSLDSRTSAVALSGCSSHANVVDGRGQMTATLYPPNCTSVYLPMDTEIIAATKLIYRRQLLDVKASTMLVAATLCARAKERK